MPSVITAYEGRVQKLEEEKLLIKERMASAGRPASRFDVAVRTALEFLANPCNLWVSERLEDKRAVLKLAFADRLRYERNQGFRTADLSLPFKVLGSISGGEREMASPRGGEPLGKKPLKALILRHFVRIRCAYNRRLGHGIEDQRWCLAR